MGRADVEKRYYNVAVLIEAGGSFSAEHGVGLDKREACERHADRVKRDLAKAIKALIDPGKVMNPGKVVG
ncbi:FAD-linked oxidase C-terminal domain-containing protein [Mesorhizobium australafricanum]|uniref:FAD-linked oxidase C-terminal domain-containing protein n=1 Tax=Mesorhizobium australafricanum TaxID=3072311 RepID=A0ABU4X3T2_9HYPH|nr:FAD-linked oxidase C-terminal domain-containing protein [Mesorhizobium sp. VK3E]MDX8442965.1 FAD-linked oxidase C-terminal domain-containing protein [Mesorhizobium sp. VK3E]